MAAAHRLVVAGLREPLQAVLAEGFQHAIPGDPVLALAREDRLVDQPGDHVQQVRLGQLPVGLRVGADALDRLEFAAADEHGQPAPQQPLGFGAGVERPVDARPQGLLPVRSGAASPVQQGEPVGEPVQDLLRAQRPELGGRQFDRERDTVEAATDAGHRDRQENEIVHAGVVGRRFKGQIRSGIRGDDLYVRDHGAAWIQRSPRNRSGDRLS